MRIDYLLLGYCDVKIPGCRAVAFLNLCHEYGLVYQPLAEMTEDLVVRCRKMVARRMLALCRERGLDASVIGKGGLPDLAFRYRKRYGLFVGGLVAALMVWASCNVVWDVRISGEGNVDLSEVSLQLQESGLSLGAWIPSLDTDAVEEQLLVTSHGVAWAAVNVKGTVAYVQLRPLLRPDAEAEGEGLCNLVASEDGVVESVRLLSGEVKVKAGDVVRKGQLLISGVRETDDLHSALTQAKGEVMARTEHTLVVEIPLVQEKKIYSETKTRKKTLFFFGNEIKFAKSTGIEGGNCDTIRRLETYSLLGSPPLPLMVETIEYCPYEIQQIPLAESEAQRLAYEELGRALTLELRDATLLSHRVTWELTEEACRLVCYYTCVRNIASPLPFDANGSESVS